MTPSKWTWKNVDLESGLSERLCLEFESELLEASLEGVDWRSATVSGRQVELLASLGDLYARLGKLSEGLQVDKTLVRVRPEEPVFHYNLACSHSRLGNVDQAFAALERAIRLGYDNFEHLRQDDDLENLKKHDRFQSLLEQFDPSQ